jgi:hypothetical protein
MSYFSAMTHELRLLCNLSLMTASIVSSGSRLGGLPCNFCLAPDL